MQTPPVLPVVTLLACLLASCATVDSATGYEFQETQDAGDLEMSAVDFECIRNGTKVGRFYVANPLGHLEEALEVASSGSGQSYPVGTIVQLVPKEAMVKRAAGWNPSSNDWEFFSLHISNAKTTIVERGVDDVKNNFGGNCLSCHSQADSQSDMICGGGDHGCAPILINDVIIEHLQNTDSRCD